MESFVLEMRALLTDCGKRANREGGVEDTGKRRSDPVSAIPEWRRRGGRRVHQRWVDQARTGVSVQACWGH